MALRWSFQCEDCGREFVGRSKAGAELAFKAHQEGCEQLERDVRAAQLAAGQGELFGGAA